MDSLDVTLDIDRLLDQLAVKGIRLWTEADRLKYEAPRGSLDAATRETLSRRRRELILKLTPPEDSDRFLLEDMQRAYWVGQNAGLELSTAASYYMELDVVGLSADNLAVAVNRVVARHALLRAVILPSGKQLVFREPPASNVPLHDLTSLEPVTRDARLSATRDDLCSWKIFTDRWPQFRLEASLLGGRVRLHLRFALWIMDGWSLRVFLDEILTLADDPEATLPPVGIPFARYVRARQEARRTPRHARALDYWRNRLPSLPQAPAFPFATAVAEAGPPRFRHLHRRFAPEVWAKFSNRANEIAVTPSMALCAVYAEALARFSGVDILTLTVLHSVRPGHLPEAARTIGNFGTTVLLRFELVDGEAFRDRAKRLQDQLWTDLEHGLVSGVDVVGELNAARASHRVSFPVTFTSAPAFIGVDRITQCAPVHHAAHLEVPQVILDHQLCEEADGGAVLNFDFVEQLFFPGFVEQIFEAYLGSVERLATDAREWGAERLGLTSEPIFPEIPPDHAELDGVLLHELFVQQAISQPDRVALITGSRAIRYGELHRRALAVAAQLRAMEVRPNELVAITMEKGWEQVVAALGVLMAGGAFVPVDAELPDQRRRVLYEEADVRAVLTQSSLAQTRDWPDRLARIIVDELTSAASDEPLPNAQKSRDLAYVIFTSGSTGKPKGVMIEHRSAVNTIADLNKRFSIGPKDRVLAISSLSFDLSVYDIFGLLGAGGAVVIPDAAFAKDPFHWCDLVEVHGVTVWNSVPALMQLMIEHAATRSVSATSLRLIMLSGDWIPLALPRRIAERARNARIVSLGGATEAAIWSILYPIERTDSSWRSVPYGQAMKNQSFHVLDRALNECPTWVPGSLYIGGVGLARGYWRDGEKTAAAFITHPGTGARLYKTGDLGRYLPTGDIEFLGREDFQVKIQGYRIECAEVEAALIECAGIKSAVVCSVSDRSGAKRLVAYLVADPDSDAPDAKRLQNALRARLPAYMTPSAFVVLPAMPHNANGKVDRKALPPPDLDAAKEPRRFVGPRNGLELRLADMWRNLLDLDSVGVTDNFFELGGTSFTAMRLMAQIHEATGKALQLGTLIQNPTIEALTLLLSGAPEVDGDSSVVAINASGQRQPLFLVHPVGGNVLCYVELARALGPDQPVFALRAPGLAQGESVVTSVEELAERYVTAVRLHQRHGPYHLGGWSFGGVVAYEMARRLSDAGEQLAPVIMIDTHLPDRDGAPPESDAEFIAAFISDIAEISGTAMDSASVSASPQIAAALEVFKANSRALQRWRPPTFSGRVLLIDALASGRPSSAEQWRQAAPDLLIVGVDGDHYSILSSSGLKQVVAAILPTMADERTEAEQQIVEILCAAVPDKCRGVEFESSTNLITDLGLSSIDMARILSVIEGRFDIDVFGVQPPFDFRTVGSLGRLISGRG
jgi:amino acid adenylation domain-containing protein